MKHQDFTSEQMNRFSKLTKRGVARMDARMIVGGDAEESEPIEAVREFARCDKSTLILSGDTGVGKTFAASWWLAANLDPDISCDGTDGMSGSYGWGTGIFLATSALAMVSRFKREEMVPLMRANVLVIDDLGSEFADSGGAFLSTLVAIFNERHAQERKTVITTNSTSEEFLLRYGDRIVDRVRGSGTFYELSDSSMRSRGQA